jgi:translation initiation factor 6
MRRLDINGTSCIGIFATCTDELLVLPPYVSKTKKLEDELGVTTIKTLICGCSAIGSLLSGNSNGFIVSPYVREREMEKIEKISRLSGSMNAAGNLILANDTTALVHPGLEDRCIDIIKKMMKVDVHRGTIAGLKNVGMAGVATNRGILVHPDVKEEELGLLERIFDLPVDTGTVNFGSPLVGSGMITNSKGCIVGSETTGYESGRIYETLEV